MRFNTKCFRPVLHINLERWRYNIGVDAYISNLGNIRDKDGNEMSTCACKNYLYFHGVPVHRLVMETWHPVPNWRKLTVDHRNHNTRDNRVSNLEWVTQQENSDRNIKDTAANLPRENPDDKQTPSVIAKIDNSTIFVLLNGVKIPFEDAKAIVSGNRSMKMCKAKVEDVFQKASSSKQPVEYGGYTIQKIDL